jgi:predicted GNAT superfamily acetyltransferase
MISYRVLTEVDDLEEAAGVAEAVWGVGQGVPVNLMRAIATHCGIVIGAFDGDEAIGVALAFVATQPRTIWSHMAGVRPEYQGRKVGSGLKWAQRKWALENGCDEIQWTFDPLQRGNANFNLRLLGATISQYYPNYYGIMNDLITGDMPSDRLIAEWKLRDPVVEALAHGQDIRAAPPDPTPDAILLQADANGQPIITSARSPRVYAQVPNSLKALREYDPGAALAWRMAQREVLMGAFAAGYRLTQVAHADDRTFFVLERAD